MTQQVPAILKSKKKIKAIQPKPQFTQSEIQRIHSMNRKFLKDINEVKQVIKVEMTQAWDLSIPGTESGAEAYSRLNKLRDILKDIQKDETNFISIQRKLKKMMS